METLLFEAAVRLLIDDASSNFTRFRGKNRTPEEPVMTAFDIGFAVQGARDTFVSLLDYDRPHVHIEFYDGPDAAAAALVFEHYIERLGPLASGPGKRSELTQDHDGRSVHWQYVSFQTSRGVWITAECVSSQRAAGAALEYRVRVKVTGHDIECIVGAPEDSLWHIFFAGSPLQAKTGETADPGVRKKRPRRGKGRSAEG